MKKYITAENFFITFLVSIVTLPVIAPVLSAIGLHSISKLIYFVFSFACHQFASRSLYIADWQYAWCARDFGIWVGMLAGTLLFKFGFLNKIKTWMLIIFLLPIALDGGIQTIFTFLSIQSEGLFNLQVEYLSNNFLRFLTGSFLGLGLALFIAPNVVNKSKLNLPEKLNFSKIKKSIPTNTSPFTKIFISMIFLVLLYIIFIQIWTFTSEENKPTNFLDSVPKTQEGFFFSRRSDGECPVNSENDLYEIRCFFENE